MRTLLLSLLALQTPPGSEAEQRVRARLDRVIADQQKRLEGEVELWHDHSTWENAWEYHSRHYLVRNTRSYHVGQQLALDLEQMLDRYCELLDCSAPSSEMSILVFPDLQAYNDFGNPYGYHSSNYGSFVPEDRSDAPVATFYTSNRVLLNMWATHGAVHQILQLDFPGTHPTPLVEGLASYFASHWNFKYERTRLRQLVQAGQYAPVQDLLNGPLDAYDEAHYIEIGMLFSYLLFFREDTCDPDATDGITEGPAVQYLRLAVRGQDLSGNAVQELFTAQTPALNKDFRAFALSE